MASVGPRRTGLRATDARLLLPISSRRPRIAGGEAKVSAGRWPAQARAAPASAAARSLGGGAGGGWDGGGRAGGGPAGGRRAGRRQADGAVRLRPGWTAGPSAVAIGPRCRAPPPPIGPRAAPLLRHWPVGGAPRRTRGKVGRNLRARGGGDRHGKGGAPETRAAGGGRLLGGQRRGSGPQLRNAAQGESGGARRLPGSTEPDSSLPLESYSKSPLHRPSVTLGRSSGTVFTCVHGGVKGMGITTLNPSGRKSELRGKWPPSEQRPGRKTVSSTQPLKTSVFKLQEGPESALIVEGGNEANIQRGQKESTKPGGSNMQGRPGHPNQPGESGDSNQPGSLQGDSGGREARIFWPPRRTRIVEATAEIKTFLQSTRKKNCT
ncbi:uncharacterized protein [Manis javanica]|uniref:uncharacterized protein n=1 Tax=Manis javanica TaxID=9974 RepID=UPI003C6CE3C7